MPKPAPTEGPENLVTALLPTFAISGRMSGWTSTTRRSDRRLRAPHPSLGGGGLGRRLSLIVAVLALVASGLAFGQSRDASAAINNLFPADVDGFPKGVFFADEALFLTATSDFEGGQVCIVDAGVTNPASANCRGGAAWGSPNTYITIGTLLGVPLEAPLLAPGSWRLLSTDVSGKNGLAISEVFEVRPCQGPCDTSVGVAQVEAWKDRADGLATAHSAASAAADVWTAGDAIWNAGRGMYALAGGGLLGLTLGVGFAGFNYVYDTSTEAKARTLFKELTAATGQMYADIAADPPDFDYGFVAQPEFRPLLVTGDALLDEYFDELMRLEANGVASRIAYERFQGAVIDGDDDAAAVQSQAAADFTFAMVGHMRTVQDLQPQVAALGWLAGPISTAEGLAESLAERARIAADGHTPEQLQELQAAGLTPEQIAALEAGYGDDVDRYTNVDPSRSFGDRLTELTALLPDTIEAYDAFGRSLAVIATEYGGEPPTPNQAPVSAFTATPISGETPLTVTLTSQASDPDGDTLSLRWDIGGARFVDDEATVTHTFTSPGEYWVSLVATDPDGLWDQAVRKITVYPSGTPNQAPVASFTPQNVDRVGPFEQTFTSTSTDADGDALTHTWYFGDGTSEVGETVTKTFQPGYVMSVLLVVSDGRASDQASGEVIARGGAPNDPPIAGFDAAPSSGSAPLEVSFTSTSTDPDADPLTHTWYFGDGQQESGAGVTTHTYAFPGTYTVTLVVSDGLASTSTTQEIVVSDVAVPLDASFTASLGHDAASLFNGGAVVDTPVASHPSYPVTNLIGPSSYWRTDNGDTSEQTIIVRLGGDGRDLIDRVALTPTTGTNSVKTFSIALADGTNPFAGYTTVIDRAELARGSTAVTFPFAPQRARFLKLTVHDNHGSSYLRLDGLAALTPDRHGGIVSLQTPAPATIESVTSEYSASYGADRILTPSGYWSTPDGITSDQTIRVRLGAIGPHTIDRIVLRGRDHDRSLQDFEIWVSETGADGSFAQVLDDTLARSTGLQEFPIAPVAAAVVEIRLQTNHGDSRYLYLDELRVLRQDGTNVADGADLSIGASVDDVSSESVAAANAIAPDAAGSYWRTAHGATTDQFLAVELREGEIATIDRVSVRGTSYLAKNVEIQVSTDGAAYTTVASRQLLDTSGADQTITFPPIEARYVKLVIVDGWRSDYVRIDRFRVFASDRGGTTVPLPMETIT